MSESLHTGNIQEPSRPDSAASGQFSLSVSDSVLLKASMVILPAVGSVVILTLDWEWVYRLLIVTVMLLASIVSWKKQQAEPEVTIRYQPALEAGRRWQYRTQSATTTSDWQLFSPGPQSRVTELLVVLHIRPKNGGQAKSRYLWIECWRHEQPTIRALRTALRFDSQA